MKKARSKDAKPLDYEATLKRAAVILKREANIDVDDLLRIDMNDVSFELSRQPATYARYASMHVVMLDKLARKEVALSSLKGELEIEIRRTWDRKYPTARMTDARVESLRRNHPDFIKANDEYYAMAEIVHALGVLAESLRQRKDALVSIGAIMRTEMETSLYLKDRTKSK